MVALATDPMKQLRYASLAFWLVMLVSGFYLYFFDHGFLGRHIAAVFASSALLGYALYLLLGCLRGFTIVPVTYLIIAGIVFIPPLPLYILTIVGVMVSSACIYYFAEHVHLKEFFESRYTRQVAALRDKLSRNELPIVIAWSFLPFAPTDLICYVCGALQVDIRTFLFGVFVGEGVSCAIYIFLGKRILGLVHINL